MKAEEKESVAMSMENTRNEAPQATAPLTRPKRNIMQKNLEYNNGLLWREEKDLKKALYASLQESKRNRVSESEGDGSSETHSMTVLNGSKKRKNGASANGNLSEDEGSNASPKRSRTKVHAQRKFAQGSNPNSPAPTPVKFRSNAISAVDLLPSKRPKTEDFLTFLCLRGTSMLPPSLDFFSLATRSEISCDSRCQSPVNCECFEKQKICLKHHGVKTLGKNGKWARAKSGIKSKDKSHNTDSEISISDEEFIPKTERQKNDGRRDTDHHESRKSTSELPPGCGGRAKPLGSVQALKQKYKQQRLEKQQKALAQAKKMLDANLGSKKEKSRSCALSGENGNNLKTEDEPRGRKKSSPDVSPQKKSQLYPMKSKTCSSPSDSVKTLRHRKLDVAVVPKQSSSPKKPESSRPVTRNSTMMTRSLREELDRAAFEASKRASDSGLLKRENAKKKVASSPQPQTMPKKSTHDPSMKSNKPELRSLRPRLRSNSSHLSDFSSDDDEPLSKKAKSSSSSRSSRSSTRKASEDSWVPAYETRKSSPRPATSAAGEGRVLRSSNSGSNKRNGEEPSVPRTVSSRPSRKTKEAATVYLELLGRRLMTPDLFEDEELSQSKPKPKMSHKKGSNKVKKSKVSKSTPSPPHIQTRAQRGEGRHTRHSSAADPPVLTKMKSAKNKTKSLSDYNLSATSMESLASSQHKPRLKEKLKKMEVGESKKKVGKVDNEREVPKLVKKEAVDNVSDRQRVSKCVNEGEKSNIKTTAKSNFIPEAIKYELPIGLDDHCNYTKKPKFFHNLYKDQDSAKTGSKKSPTKESKYKKQSMKEKSLPAKEEDALSVQDKFGSSSSYRGKLTKHDYDSSIECLTDFLHKDRDLHGSFADLPDFDDGSVHVGETTSIAVKENVTSNSVAIQVNLVDDLSDFEDELLDFAGSDFGSENSLSLERILTPSYFSESFAGTSKGRLESLLFPSSQSDGQKAKSTRSSESSSQNKCQPSPSPSPVKSKAKSSTKPDSTVSNSSRSATPIGRRRGRPPGSGKAKTECVPENHLKSLSLEEESSLGLLEAPTFTPSEEEFQDPLEYIEKIRPEAEKFGICRIIPPAPFKPECKVNDDMRFTAHNQYIHKMFHRSGPNMLQLMSIKRHLESQGGDLEQVSLIGGMELDLPKLYQVVEKHGGIKEVIEKKKWQKVADTMKIPKSAQDRITKLYDAYCKYLLSYSMLTKDERQKLEHQVQMELQRKKNKANMEINECVTKGRSMSLSSFYRIARNTMAMWFKDDPESQEVEDEYWELVTERKHHVCVHAGNVDSSVYGYGFTCNKSSTFAKHPWNLKVLTNNPGSVLRSMGPVMGVTIPTLHVGMLFTTGCWYRDPHCLPWIEYLHAGANKIWYGVPASQTEEFRTAMKQIVPEYSTNNPIWLPSDTAMVPPTILVKNGASLCRVIQESGQFVLVFPRAFTSTICCGYTVSESVYFAHQGWLETAEAAFKDIRDSCEPTVFSLERLFFCIAADSRTTPEVLLISQPVIEQIRQNELSLRKVLYDLGLKTSERLHHGDSKDGKRRRLRGDEEEYECDICRANCYVSMVVYPEEDIVYCLNHAIEHLQKKKRDLKHFKLLYTYDQAELNELVQKLADKINALTQKGPCKKSPKKKLL